MDGFDYLHATFQEEGMYGGMDVARLAQRYMIGQNLGSMSGSIFIWYTCWAYAFKLFSSMLVQAFRGWPVHPNIHLQ